MAKTVKRKRLSNEEIASFCRQTAMIVEAGITPAEGMDIILNDTLSEEGKAIITEIRNSCRIGDHLYQALEQTGVFPDYVVRLISLGEESGTTDTVLISLAEYYDREAEISYNIHSAISYPLIMIAMMFAIIIVLIAKVLPIFQQVFTQLGTEMTPFAERLMNIGSYMSRYAIATTFVLAGIVALFIILFRVPPIRAKMRLKLAKFPLTRELYDNIAAGRFASSMYLAFTSGMDTFHSLEMVRELVENENMEKKVDEIKEEVLSGNSNLADAISKSGVFSNLYSRMISVGFRSGNVDVVMKQIAEAYETVTEKKLRTMVSIIEPTLVIILSLIVGVILLSVLLPLMGIMSSIG